MLMKNGALYFERLLTALKNQEGLIGYVLIFQAFIRFICDHYGYVWFFITQIFLHSISDSHTFDYPWRCGCI